jgi:exopolyphosphatase/guanosine-5'-triphosphate,3'-diphosphate pyrophosphatase
MPGFSRDVQHELSLLVLNHRRKLRAPSFDELPKSHRKTDLRLCTLLRLAVRLNRNRALEDVPVTRLEAGGGELTLTFPKGWLDQNPLTRADLEHEDRRLESAIGMRLRLNEE